MFYEMSANHIWKFVKLPRAGFVGLFLSGLNLLFMHYYILLTSHIETELDLTMFADNLLGVSFDVCIIFFVFYYLSWRRWKTALLLCFAVTWLWSFSNVMYSRFFFHYLTMSAIGQGGVLTDSLIIRCLLDNISWTDSYYLFSSILMIPITKSIKKEVVSYSVVRKILIGLCAAILVDLSVHAVYCVFHPQLRFMGYYCHRIYVHHCAIHRNMSQPNFANFSRGSIRTIFTDMIVNCQGSIGLTGEQRRMIATEIERERSQLSDVCLNDSVKNIVFILVESYMSFTSEMKVNGREVTPFLNALKHDSLVYYNGTMHENVTIGESSDGQFIYMTGLLPLRSVITVSKARRTVQPGMPRKIGRDSRMIIPTTASMWNQEEMCRQYGFDILLASNDYADGRSSSLNDEQVFQMAMQKDNEAYMPFFSVILTMSMHQPYTKQIDPTFPVTDSSIPKDLACYLNACHYTDRQIERYFEHLKQTGLYDNSLIVIAADHSVHNTDFGGVSKDIPLYLVNVPKEIQARMWHGECNQIDVYFTLLDLFGIESDWYGLGQSLISPDYSNHIDERKWDVSEWIIRGDYFSK